MILVLDASSGEDGHYLLIDEDLDENVFENSFGRDDDFGYLLNR